MKTLRSDLETVANLSGSFAVLDCWNVNPSPYVITLSNGALVGVTDTQDKTTRFALVSSNPDHGFAGYMARRFGLLMSLAACAYHPDAIGNEDALGLGNLNS